MSPPVKSSSKKKATKNKDQILGVYFVLYFIQIKLYKALGSQKTQIENGLYMAIFGERKIHLYENPTGKCDLCEFHDFCQVII